MFNPETEIRVASAGVQFQDELLCGWAVMTCGEYDDVFGWPPDRIAYAEKILSANEYVILGDPDTVGDKTAFQTIRPAD